jgi:acetyl esterase/lipase
MQLTKRRKISLIILAVFLILVLLITSFVVCAEGTGNSYQSVVANGIFRMLAYNTKHNSREWGLARLEKTRKINENYTVPGNYLDNYNLDVYKIDNFEVVVFNKNASSGKYVFYLHGGAFTEQPLVFHYDFLKKLSKETNSTIVMPIYPKAPNYTYETSISMVLNTYLDLATRVASENITIMGDSAGASMSLSLCQYFSKNDINQPKDIILFSPMMDGKLDNPEIVGQQEKDLMLALETLKVKVESYAGGCENLENYLVSPIYGDFTNLAPITIFMGTEEILLPDVRLFVTSMQNEIPIEYYEYDNMLHDFAIFPMREGKEVRQIIKNIMAK